MTQFLIRRFIRHPNDPQDPATRTAYGNLASGVGMACNLLLCLGKLLAGTLFGSIAIMADALNNLSDASSNVGQPHRLPAGRQGPGMPSIPTATPAMNIWPVWWSV